LTNFVNCSTAAERCPLLLLNRYNPDGNERRCSKADRGCPKKLCCPEWLLACWSARYGAEAVAGIARAALEAPETYVRITPAGTRSQDIGSQKARWAKVRAETVPSNNQSPGES